MGAGPLRGIVDRRTRVDGLEGGGEVLRYDGHAVTFVLETGGDA